MRVVLLGSREDGKSSSGNSILGREEFDTSGRTAECVKREGETAGRRITVVEAPGWWSNYTVDQTPERDKREFVLSVSLCPPGSHALLLTIRMDTPFTETHRRAVQEHMELLGVTVWSHTIVLFTRGDWLGDTTIEQHIESGGEALQWVVEKCGNRYHVVNNKKKDDGQVRGLLEKIEEVVAGNIGNHYEIPRKQARSKEKPPLFRLLRNSLTNMFKLSNTVHLDDSGCSSLGSKSEDGIKSEPCPKLTSIEERMTKAFLTRVPLVDKEAIKIDLQHLIGGGAFGKVYRGSFQGSPAAIKMMSIEENPQDSLETIIPLRLSHPNIVRMLAVSRMERQIIIAYEYIHGANLHQVLWDKQCSIKLDNQDKLCVALEIAMAIEYSHGRNVIHQDIKPANILISQRHKTAYLTDWGLANMRDSLAQFGAVGAGDLCGPHGAGTELYTAPELLLNNERCSTMSDMWSLGITYLEMFTNCEPWTLNNRGAITGMLSKQEPPHALAKLQALHDDIVKPLITYDPKSRMNAADLVALLKSKVDLDKIYGFQW